MTQKNYPLEALAYLAYESVRNSKGLRMLTKELIFISVPNLQWFEDITMAYGITVLAGYESDIVIHCGRCDEDCIVRIPISIFFETVSSLRKAHI